MQGRTDDVITVIEWETAEEHISNFTKNFWWYHQYLMKLQEVNCSIFVAENKEEQNLENEIMEHISKNWQDCKLKLIIQLSDLPKTRTGKIMRLLKSKIWVSLWEIYPH